MSISYTKTNWQERLRQYDNRVKLVPVSGQQYTYDMTRIEGTIAQAGTALSPTNLNHIESGIEGAYNAINQLSNDILKKIDMIEYNNYLERLELYYRGTLSNIDISAFRGMTFDGFVDNNRIDTTDMILDTTNKRLNGKYSTAWGHPNSVSWGTMGAPGFTHQTGSSYILGNASDTIDSSNASSVSVHLPTGGYHTYACLAFDFGAIKLFNGIKLVDHLSSSGAGIYTTIQYSLDGVTWATLSASPDHVSDNWILYNGDLVRARYVVLELHMTGDGGDSGSFYVYDILFDFCTRQDSSLLTKLITLPESMKNFTLYLSAHESLQSFKPYIKNGSNNIALIEDTRYRITDPLFNTCIEKKYFVQLEAGINNFQLYFADVIDTSQITADQDYIKRYGCLWGW